MPAQTVVDSSPVRLVLDVSLRQSFRQDAAFREPPRTGHSLLIVRRGRLAVDSDERRYDLCRGEALWLCEGEDLRAQISGLTAELDTTKQQLADAKKPKAVKKKRR